MYPAYFQVILSDGRPPLRYDIMSINIGSAPRALTATADQEESPVVPVKPIDGFGRRWDALLKKVAAWDFGDTNMLENGTHRMEQNKQRKKLRIVVVGGGAGGVELVLSMQYRIGKQLQRRGIIGPFLNKSDSNKSNLSSSSAPAHAPPRQFFQEPGRFVDISLATRSKKLLPTHSRVCISPKRAVKIPLSPILHVHITCNFFLILIVGSGPDIPSHFEGARCSARAWESCRGIFCGRNYSRQGAQVR